MLARRSPRGFAHWLRRTGGAALDLYFDETSPIPMLPPHLTAKLGVHEVTLPPACLLGPGNQEPIGMIHLVCLAKALTATSVLEIGTYNGVTALTLANNLPNATVHTLDLPPGEMPHLPVHTTDPLNFSTFGERAYKNQPAEHRVIQHLGDSATFDFAPLRGTCQLVYIDGAHSYEYVMNDSRVASHVLGDSGAIVWDDYRWRVPGVPRYLNSLKQRNLYRLPNSRLVVWFSSAAFIKLDSASAQPAR